MPNHVTNRVWFTGDPVDVWAAIRSFTNDDGDVDFERVLPMPEELHGDVPHNEVCAAKGKPTFGPVDESIVETLRENIRKHGYAYWYDWAIANWGTKWNAYSQSREPREVDLDEASVGADKRMADGDETAEAFAIAMRRGEQLDAVLVFETAWSAPTQLLVALSRCNPAVHVHLVYADEDTGSNLGVSTWHNGERVLAWTPPTKSEAVRFAHRVRGTSPLDNWKDFYVEYGTTARERIEARLEDPSVRDRYCEAFYAAFDEHGWSWEQAHRAGFRAALEPLDELTA